MSRPPRPHTWTLSSITEKRPPALPIVARTRPVVRGAQCVVSTTHYLATLAGQRIAMQGGTAIDAGIAAGIALNVVEPQMCNFGGVAPIMVYRPGMDQPETIDGLGRWPKGINLPEYASWYDGDIPIGIERSVTPAACDAWLTCLARNGTLSLAEVMKPSIELCENGFPVNELLELFLTLYADRFDNWPSSAEVLMPGGCPPKVGEIFKQPDLGRLFRRLVDSETEALQRGASRDEAIMAARDEFYSGSVAREISAFFEAEQWPLTAEDLAAQQVLVEAPVSSTYRGHQVFSCKPWCQGPLVPMTLNLLENFDIASMGAGSAEFIHHYTEAFKLAAADREGFFGDPDFVDVPIEVLLSKEYAKVRAQKISSDLAAPELPIPGDPWPLSGRTGRDGYVPVAAEGVGSPDTSYVCAMDMQGNAFSATPSDHVCGGPMVPGLGIIISPRGGQSWTDPNHPSAIAPGKRPRLTPNPAMLMKNGKVTLAFGSPGEDMQTQAMVQMLCNMIDFGLDVQEAIEAPRAASHSFPWSYHPHPYRPGVLHVEQGAQACSTDELQKLGHKVEIKSDFSPGMGAVCAAGHDGVCLVAGSDPRRDGVALAW